MVKKTQTNPQITFSLNNSLLVLSIIAAISILFFSPAHFSIAAITIIVFCLYSLHIKAFSRINKKVIAAHIAFFLVLLWFLIGSLLLQTGLVEPSCAAFFGEQVTCFTYQDLGYVYSEVVGSVIVITSLYVLQVSYKKSVLNSKRKLKK